MRCTDEELRALLEAAREGDRVAFEDCVSALDSELVGYIERRLGSALRARLEIDDLVQETHFQAWRNIDRFEWRGRQEAGSWFKRIAEFAILNAVRKLSRHDVVYIADKLPESAVEPTALRELRRQERFERLRKALAELPDDYRQAVLLVRVEGLRVREAAARMGRTPKAVTHLILRAVAMLRTAFGDTDSLGLPSDALERLKSDDEEQG